MSKKVTTESFILKAKQIHGDKYDYSKVEYIDSKTKLCIICPEHGEFWMTPGNHISQKQGCPKCKGKNLTTDDVIKKFKEVHGNLYDYSKVIYKKMHEKVIIVCPIHGEFLQTPSKHILGRRCPYCFGTKRKTTEEFIKEVREIHSDKYDYSLTLYGKNSRDPVKIICKIHGEFWQTPAHHINCRCGCPKCNHSHGEEILYNYFNSKSIEFKELFTIIVPEEIRPTKIIKVDFYLPSYNTFIEYNGKQHYIMLKGFGGQSKFDKQIIRDEYLRKYCKDMNIKLIEISYMEKDIIKYLESKLYV